LVSDKAHGADSGEQRRDGGQRLSVDAEDTDLHHVISQILPAGLRQTNPKAAIDFPAGA
jgi:hypothetical protein